MTRYLELILDRLTEGDFELLAALGSGRSSSEIRRLVFDDPQAVAETMADPALYRLVFDSPDPEVVTGLSPLFVFAVLVHRALADLALRSYVAEWVGAGERLPVFDAASLREAMDDPKLRFMVADLLGSFTRVASGSVWVRTERGYRKRRFSELDPVALAEIVESLPAGRRAGGYRRLGEVSLFLTGVFPDHTSRHPMSPDRQSRLARLAGVEPVEPGDLEYLWFLERVGRSSYLRAASEPAMPTSLQETLGEMAANFTRARRFLNYIADEYLHRVDTGLMNPVG